MVCVKLLVVITISSSTYL